MNEIDDHLHFFQEDQIRFMRRKMVNGLIISIGAMVLASFALLWGTATHAFVGAYFLGALVGLLSGIVGFLTIEKSIDKSNLAFMKGVFVGMGIRLLSMLGIFIILVKIFNVHIIALVIGLLIFYFAMTIFEIIFLNKRIAFQHKDSGSGARKNTIESDTHR